MHEGKNTHTTVLKLCSSLVLETAYFRILGDSHQDASVKQPPQRVAAWPGGVTITICGEYDHLL